MSELIARRNISFRGPKVLFPFFKLCIIAQYHCSESKVEISHFIRVLGNDVTIDDNFWESVTDVNKNWKYLVGVSHNQVMTNNHFEI